MNKLLTLNKDNRIGFILFLIDLGLFVIGVVGMTTQHILEKSNFILANCCLGIFAMGIIMVLQFGCVIETQKTQSRTLVLELLLFAIFVHVLSSALSWAFDGNGKIYILTWIITSINYIFGYAVVYLFTLYVYSQFEKKSLGIKTIVYAMGFFTVAFMALVVLNAFIHIFFKYNADGVYERGPVYFLSQMNPLVIIPIDIVLVLTQKRMKLKTRLALLLYALFPIAAIILQLFVYGISYIEYASVIGMITVYINVYVEKNKELVDQNKALMVSQINPQFISNTINMITDLCDTNPVEAKLVSKEFVNCVQRNLSSLDQDATIPFSQELWHVESYLKIEQSRLGSNLIVQMDTPDRNFLIPPLSLQIIVENAVKSGVEASRKMGTVWITTKETKDEFLVSVEDSGFGFDVSEINDDMAEHTGLRYVRNRVREYCRGDVIIKSVIGKGTTIDIKIPKIPRNLL